MLSGKELGPAKKTLKIQKISPQNQVRRTFLEARWLSPRRVAGLLWIEPLLLFPLRIARERESFHSIRKDLGYSVATWDTGGVVGFPYLDIFKKIAGGFLSGTVCIQSCLETRRGLDRHVLGCTGDTTCCPGSFPARWGKENTWGLSFPCCGGKGRSQVRVAGARCLSAEAPPWEVSPRAEVTALPEAPRPVSGLVWNAPYPGSSWCVQLSTTE